MKYFKSLEPLFVLEMANNHMGDVKHGLRIIDEMHEAVRDFRFNLAIKLQYRHLDTFIHPDFRDRTDVKYVKRFSETRLDPSQFKALRDRMKALGFVAVCTPFDEPSVDLIEEHDFDIIKVASCSFTDWPLLERIASSYRPVIASTAGVPLEDIDKVVSFFDHRSRELALMHCVGEYPTPDAHLRLNQIRLLKDRYPHLVTGFSTHEDPDRTEYVGMAIAAGATILEKHVGVPTDQYPLNAYSASPEQVRRWLEAAREAFEICGVSGRRAQFDEKEISGLRSLQRGVFARRPIRKGERMDPADLFFAMPASGDQLTANDMSKYAELHALEDINVNAPLLASNTGRRDIREKVYDIVQRVKDFFRESSVIIPPKVDLEISHHYGIDRFDEFGLTMITIVNREYCKKLLVLLPGQKHPEQYHTEKEETFHVLHGEVRMILDGDESLHNTGEVITVERGVRHSFEAAAGAVIEEISSTHITDDSYYTDPAIAENQHRKTRLTYWMD
ncbi:MAG: N-acetylneuraminate synthase family protein [Deltaproteobacteria bacterium]|nr:N-acetylneuraminate synthase family protein [Deltaproteobacteria bacterium]